MRDSITHPLQVGAKRKVYLTKKNTPSVPRRATSIGGIMPTYYGNDSSIIKHLQGRQSDTRRLWGPCPRTSPYTSSPLSSCHSSGGVLPGGYTCLWPHRVQWPWGLRCPTFEFLIAQSLVLNKNSLHSTEWDREQSFPHSKFWKSSYVSLWSSVTIYSALDCTCLWILWPLKNHLDQEQGRKRNGGLLLCWKDRVSVSGDGESSGDGWWWWLHYCEQT